MFTDQPSPDARVVASYQTSRPARRAETSLDEPSHDSPSTTVSGFSIRPVAPVVAGESSRRYDPATGKSTEPAADRMILASGEQVAAASSRLPVEAERAARTYTPLQSPLAFQVDANESARRAQQEVRKDKDAAAGVLIVKPLPREHEPTPRYEGVTTFYVMWAATFFLLAAGLLYVGWQVIRLILRSAFPRWQLGLG